MTGPRSDELGAADPVVRSGELGAAGSALRSGELAATGPTLRPGELAAAVGVGIPTLRYYERRGLLPAPGRSPGGHRVYPRSAIDRLRAVKAAQSLGFTLTEVGALLGARNRRGAGFADRARAKLAEGEARIADLQDTAETLRAAVDAGCDDLATCAAESRCPIPFGAPAAG